MGWDKGRYYTRSRKVNGRVEREYIGGGEIGELAALIDTDRRVLRQEQAEAWEQAKAQMEAQASQVVEMCDLVDVVAQAALVAAGYHQHNRGEWRRKRVRPDQSRRLDATPASNERGEGQAPRPSHGG